MRLNSGRTLSTLVGIVVIVGSAVSLRVIQHYPPGAGGAPGPAAWPRILLVTAIIVASLMIIEVWRSADYPVFENSAVLPVLAAIICVAYVLAIQPTGYFVASLIFWPLTMSLLGVRSLRTLVGVTLGFNAVVYVLFDVLMKASLPSGFISQLLH